DEEIDVVDRLARTAVAACDFGAEAVGMLAQRGEDLLDRGGHVAEAEAVGVALAEGDGLEELLRRLLPEARQFRHLARFAERLEPGPGIDPQRFVEDLDLLRTESLEVEKLEEPGGELRLQLFVESERSGRGEFVELLLERVAEAFDASEAPLAGESRDVAGILPHRLRPAAVGADFEGVLPL